MLYKIDRLFGRAGSALQELNWLIFRSLASALFFTHGYDKLFGANAQPLQGGGMTTVNIADLVVFAMPLDINLIYVAGVVECVGGALLFIGLWTHMIAFIAAIEMLLAYLIVHLAWFPTLNNGEMAALYFLIYLALFSAGPGQYSLDAWLELRRQDKQDKKLKSHGLPPLKS